MKKFLKSAVALLASATLCAVLALPIFATEPYYEYSAEYKSSKYYTALMGYELTGDIKKDIVGIAKTQVGYHEGNDIADMHGNKISGNSDFVEYNRLSGEVGGTYGYAWCASFIIWCARHAGITDADVCADVNCRSMFCDFSKSGRYYQRETGFLPAAGDLVFFGDELTKPNHVGIVTDVKNNKVYTVEGDLGNQVMSKSYDLNDDNIKGYAVIKQEVGEFFVMKSTDLFAENGKYVKTVPAGETLTVTSINGFKGVVTQNGTEAFVDMIFLFPLKSVSFTVSYDSGEGKGAPSDQHRKPGETMVISDKIPTFRGYSFLGWATKEGGEVVYRPGDKYTNNASIVLHAVWKPNQHTVKFVNPNGDVISEKVYLYCDEVAVPDDPTMATDGVNKFVFEKWDTAVQKYCLGDATYTAVYTSIPLTDEEKAQLTAAIEEEGGCSSFVPTCALAAVVLSAVTLKKKKN